MVYMFEYETLLYLSSLNSLTREIYCFVIHSKNRRFTLRSRAFETNGFIATHVRMFPYVNYNQNKCKFKFRCMLEPVVIDHELINNHKWMRESIKVKTSKWNLMHIKLIERMCIDSVSVLRSSYLHWHLLHAINI